MKLFFMLIIAIFSCVSAKAVTAEIIFDMQIGLERHILKTVDLDDDGVFDEWVEIVIDLPPKRPNVRIHHGPWTRSKIAIEQDISTNLNFEIYFNRNKLYFNNFEEEKVIKLYNIQGNLIDEISNLQSNRINLNHLNSGAYIVVVEYMGIFLSQKFIIN